MHVLTHSSQDLPFRISLYFNPFLTGPPIQKRRHSNYNCPVSRPKLVQGSSLRRPGRNDTIQLRPGEEKGRRKPAPPTPRLRPHPCEAWRHGDARGERDGRWGKERSSLEKSREAAQHAVSHTTHTHTHTHTHAPLLCVDSATSLHTHTLPPCGTIAYTHLQRRVECQHIYTYLHPVYRFIST